MIEQQQKLLQALTSYDLTQIMLNFHRVYINSNYQGQPLLSIFTKDCLQKLKRNQSSHLIDFLKIYQRLIELGSNPDLMAQSTGKSILHEVIEFGTNNLNETVLFKILESSNINQLDYNAKSCFSYALTNNNYYALNFIGNHPNFNITPNIIIEATKFCTQPNILNKIFSVSHIDYSMIKSIEQNNLLHIALLHSNKEAIPFLINLRINPLEKNVFNKPVYEYGEFLISSFPILKKYIDYYLLNEHFKHIDCREKVKKI